MHYKSYIGHVKIKDFIKNFSGFKIKSQIQNSRFAKFVTKFKILNTQTLILYGDDDSVELSTVSPYSFYLVELVF